jgi:hypothetical protein
MILKSFSTLVYESFKESVKINSHSFYSKDSSSIYMSDNLVQSVSFAQKAPLNMRSKTE